jgi:ribose transport system permease protein
MKHIEKPVVIAFGCNVALVLGGSIFFPQILSVKYLLQQLHIACFLGLIAGGAMVVILLGHIDLSVAWTLTAAAIFSTSIAGGAWGDGFVWAAVPVGLFVGAIIGAFNGIGVAYLRIPSMIWTLGVNFVVLGFCVLYTGGHRVSGQPTEMMRFFGVGKSIFNIPNALYLWFFLSIAISFVLRRTTLGRYIYGIGNSERVTFLSGVNTDGVLILAFVIAGVCNAIAGMMLAGYANQAYQAMGEPYLLPCIAAVVIGGTNILGGSGTYLGTVAGVILITLMSSMVSVMQMPEAGRQIVFGSIIILMVLIYGRGQRIQT